MKENNIYISTNIQFLRKLNNKTQKEIGDLCDKTDTAISNWEKGIREPDATDLGILANYFGITVDDIMFKDLRFQESSNDKASANHIDDDIDVLLSAYKDLPDIDKRWVKNMVIERRNLIDEQLENNKD